MASPLHIKLLLHFHVSGEKWPGPWTQTTEDYVNQLVEAGILRLEPKYESGYATTTYGRRVVQSLCEGLAANF